jgi:hypothetical protein
MVQYILAVQYSDTKLERKIFRYERYPSAPAAAAVVALSSNNYNDDGRRSSNDVASLQRR